MIHMIGNAHIDPVWLWQWREGYQEVKATFQSALDRLDESDDFVFTAACADYYRWVDENAPEMFKKIQARVAEGRWKIAGGMWIQPDCNTPSGESFARHLLYSQRFFKEKLGVTVNTGWNVDSFGHSIMLPALLKRGGIDNYVFLRPGEHENANIPFPLFKWTSPDGSSVNAFRIIDGYGSRYGSVEEDVQRAMEMEAKMGYPIMCFYGVGNHGGGPTIKNIASIHSLQEKGLAIKFSDPDTYFNEIKEMGVEMPEWKNELQHHASGCYSATSLIKMLNRRVENALIRCEFFDALSDTLTGHVAKPLTQAWQNLMFSHFHDIMCGCSIREAYDDAQNQMGEALSIADREENAALQKISWAVDTVNGIPGRLRSKESHFGLWELDGLGSPIVVFNPHPYECEAPVGVYGSVAYVTDESDNELPVQTVRASRTNGADKWDSVFLAKVPALGYRLYWVYLAPKGIPTNEYDRKIITPDDDNKELIAASGLKVTENSIENDVICAKFDPETGAMISLVTKATGRNALSGPASAKLIDIEHVDTWAHMVFKFDKEKESFGSAKFSIIEKGPVRAKLRVTTGVLDSTMIQDYTLYAGKDQIEVDVRLDMQEKFRMLKLCFPVNATEQLARAEVSYGFIERPCDGCEETGHRWMALAGKEGGVGLLNNGKYSFSAENGEIRLTVANTSIYADHYGQQTRDEMCIHGDMGMQEFRYAIVPMDGDWKDANLPRRGEVFNRKLPWIIETYHEGPLPTKYEGLSLSAENVSAGALKRAEDGNGYILRLNETAGKAVKCVVNAPMFGRTIDVELGAFDIKTLLIPDDAAAPVKEVLFTEW
ncbi:MAG: alpha-mannosidase [Clostridia bacterium]|nr:alpha-mannosidase [Clostridia bacterium]